MVVDNTNLKPLIFKITEWRRQWIFSRVKRYGHVPSWQSLEHSWFLR